MALTMLDKKAVHTAQTRWPPEIAAEFEREGKSPNGCVGQRLLSESERVRVWEIRLKPGERFGFHRHVLDYFWSALNAGRARAHLDDGATVEHTYTAGETRHETHAAGHFKVHDLENIGDSELIFTTVEFLDSANKPLPVPDDVRGRMSDVG
jgi:quercetin dioxygenase-like cupin family protein